MHFSSTMPHTQVSARKICDLSTIWSFCSTTPTNIPLLRFVSPRCCSCLACRVASPPPRRDGAALGGWERSRRCGRAADLCRDQGGRGQQKRPWPQTQKGFRFSICFGSGPGGLKQKEGRCWKILNDIAIFILTWFHANWLLLFRLLSGSNSDKNPWKRRGCGAPKCRTTSCVLSHRRKRGENAMPTHYPHVLNLIWFNSRIVPVLWKELWRDMLKTWSHGCTPGFPTCDHKITWGFAVHV